MKALFKNILSAGIVLACFAICFMSCEKKEPVKPVPPDPIDTTSTSTDITNIVATFAVANAEGSKTSMKLNMSENWIVSNDQKWFKVSPKSGFAGENEITVEVLKSNKEFVERVSTFDVKMSKSGKKISHYIIQDGKPCFNLTSSKLLFQSSTETRKIQIEGNIPFTVAAGADWIKAELEQSDSTVLADGKTKSKYMISKLSVTTTDVAGESVNVGNIVLKTSDAEYIITVFKISSEAEFTPDFNRQFLRKSLFMKFTATWCGFCPMMSEALEKAMEEYPNHIVPFMLYSKNSQGGLGGYEGSNVFAKKFNIGGFPTGVMNEYAVIENGSGIDKLIANVAKEAVEKCPSKTAIAGIFILNDGELKADLTIAAKETGNYKLSAFVLESGIVAAQNQGGSNYVHDYAVRKEITDIWGDDIALSANQVTKLTLTAPVPGSVGNAGNISLVVFITYEGTYKGEVKKVKYKDFGAVIDNVSIIDVESAADFEYEK